MRTLLVMSMLSCVPKAQHELVEIQLEATRTAMDDRDAASRAELRELQEKAAELAQDVKERDAHLDSMATRIELLQKELKAAAERQAVLTELDVMQCPPLPAPIVCEPPTEQADPVVEPESVTERRELTRLSLEDVTIALEERSLREVERAALLTHHQAVQAAFESLVTDGYAEVLTKGDATIVRVLAVKLFNENRTTLSPLGESIVERMASALKTLPDMTLSIVGHTDDKPVHSAEFLSSWELGFGYGMGVYRGLSFAGVSMVPVVSSAAGNEPVVNQSDPESRRLNRRVELWLRPDPEVLTHDNKGEAQPEESAEEPGENP